MGGPDLGGHYVKIATRGVRLADYRLMLRLVLLIKVAEYTRWSNEPGELV